MKDKPFALIGVNSDKKERVQDAIERENITWRSFWDGGSTGGPIAKRWGVRGWPTVYVIDDKGVIRYKNVRGEAMDRAVDEIVDELIGGLVEHVKSSDPIVRSWAAFRMGRYDAADAKETLTGLLEDSEPVVRGRAAAGLAALGEPAEPLQALLRTAVGDEQVDVRLAAIQALAKAGDQQMMPIAIKALQDDETRIRRVAVAALGDLKNSAAVPTLEGVLDDADAQTAKMAALAIARIGSEESKAVLKRLAPDTQHPARVWIAVGLHRLGDEETADRFQRLLAEDDAAVRRQAVAALADLADFDTLELYIQALEDDDSRVRRIASTALSESDDPRAAKALEESFAHQLDRLLPLLAGRDYQAQRKAREELRQLGPAIAPMLLDRLPDVPERGRYLVANTISQLGNPEVISPVAAKLRDPQLDTQLRNLYESILAGMRDKSREAIHEMVKHHADVVRESGIRMLSRYGDDASRTSLQAALKDSAPQVRVQAACGLSRWKDDDGLAVLKSCLEETSSRVRNTAIGGIGRYDAETALPILIKLIDDSDRSVRSTTIFTLGNFKQPKATTAVFEATKSDEALITPAMYALQRQRTTEAAKALGEFLKNENSAISNRARMYLRQMRIPEAEKILARAGADAPRSQLAQPRPTPGDVSRSRLGPWGRAIEENLIRTSRAVTASPGQDKQVYDRALRLVEAATQLQGPHPDLLFALGAARYRTGDCRGAIDALERSLAARFGGVDVGRLKQAGGKQAGTTRRGSFGFQWHQVELAVDDDGGKKGAAAMRWSIDGREIGTLDAGVGRSFVASGSVTLGYMDPFESLSDSPTHSFGLIDNLRISGATPYSDDFNSDTRAKYFIATSSPDTKVTFAFDYGGLGIPPAPHTTDGTTLGLRLEANIASPPSQEAVTIHTKQRFEGDYTIQFDAWINVNGTFPEGGRGGTECLTAGVGGNGSTVHGRVVRGTFGSGGWIAVNGDGGNKIRDFQMYKDEQEQFAESGQFAAGVSSLEGQSDQDNADPYYAGFGSPSQEWFYLAMSRWQLGEKPAAREAYGKAVKIMEASTDTSHGVMRLRAEAAALLGITDPPT